MKRGGVVGLLLAAGVLALRSLAIPRRLIPVLLLTFAAYSIFRVPSSLHARELTVWFLDVGKGDAIVMRSPGGFVGVVDSASEHQGSEVIEPFLRSRGIHRIDFLLLTHPHPDHVGGAPALISEFSPGTVVDNGFRPDHPLVRRYREAAEERGIPVRTTRQGTRLKWRDGVSLAVLAPAQAGPPGGTNNTSIVLRVEYGKRALLLAADAQADSERQMLESGQPLSADVLKVGHHGSSASTTEPFVKAVSPKLAVISVDSGNANGYPTEQTLKRLTAAGAQVLRTDRHGHITVLTDGENLRYETDRPD